MWYPAEPIQTGSFTDHFYRILLPMNPITVSTVINADIDKVWNYWNEPEHITQWAFASPEWECPHAQDDLNVGGTLKITMAAKDKSASFDVVGTYTQIVPHELIEYTMEDGRKVRVGFESIEGGTKVTETFDPESENPLEMQREGWQAILDNFKAHVESVAG